MTTQLRARDVWNDCSVAVRQMEAADDPAAFRVALVAACALLRAVGHVLEKVDKTQGGEVGTRVDSMWKEMKRHRDFHAIFWDFIEEERNILLKTYDHRYLDEGVQLVSDNRSGTAVEFTLGPDLYMPLTDGAFAGLDVRDLASDALNWWDLQLRRIERASSQNA